MVVSDDLWENEIDGNKTCYVQCILVYQCVCISATYLVCSEDSGHVRL